MAFLIKRGKIWYICEKFENKFFRKSTGTNIKGKALIKLADYVKNKKSTDGKKTKLFLSIFSQEYLNYLNKNEKSPSYIRGVKNYFQELIDFVGDINIHKIDKTLLNRFLTYKINNASIHTGRAAKSSLRPAFSHAVDLGYIESNPFDGTPYSCSFISHKFLKFIDEAGVKNKSFKTFRSTYATWLLNAGTSTMYIKNQLGHSTVRLLETHYAEFITEEFRGVVNNINVKRLTQK